MPAHEKADQAKTVSPSVAGCEAEGGVSSAN